MRIDPAAASIKFQRSIERRLEGEPDAVRERDRSVDRFKARFDRAGAAQDGTTQARVDLGQLARSVRFSLRAFLREVGRDLDKEGFAEIRQEVKALYKEFRASLGQASRAIREDGDRKTFLEAVDGAFDRLSAGLEAVIDRSTNPVTPTVPDEPVVDAEVGGTQQLRQSSDRRPRNSSEDPFDSLLRVLQRRFEALYQQLRERILPERVTPSDAPSYVRADGSVEAAIQAYES